MKILKPYCSEISESFLSVQELQGVPYELKSSNNESVVRTAHAFSLVQTCGRCNICRTIIFNFSFRFTTAHGIILRAMAL